MPSISTLLNASFLLGSSLSFGFTNAAWWQPAKGTTWAIQLSATYTTPYPKVTALDGDLFDNTKATWSNIKAGGYKTICYFSAGSYEDWRIDKGNFSAADLGDNLDGWPGERWVNTRSTKLRTAMKWRMDLAVQKGCDAIDPDNIDAYNNGGGGFSLTQTDAVDYIKFLATEAHARNMAIGLKNGLEIVSKVLSVVDFQVNEQCLQYNECSTLKPFITANKPVFQIEYREGTPTTTTVNSICTAPSRSGFSTLIKHMDLGSWYIACP